MWDLDIQSDRVIEARRSDAVVVDKKNRKSQIIDPTISNDERINM